MKVFDFEDVQLVPRRCIVTSRTQCNTTAKLGKHSFKVPMVPANMASVVNESLCIDLAKHGYFYVMHRFNFDSIAFVAKMKKMKLISSISIGVKEADYKLIDQLKAKKLIPDYITIDIAHGHAETVKKMIKYVKKTLGDKTFLIAGNIATIQAILDLERWGADATKVGVGPGKVCITKLKTGFGTGGWQLSAVNMCSKVANKPIIADGGVRVNGDVAKALRFGASFVMIGSLFAAHKESPGQLIDTAEGNYKEYFGSASEFNKSEKRYVEGKKELIKVRGSIFETLKEMQEDLQSSISYAGGNTLEDIKKVDYILINGYEGY